MRPRRHVGRDDIVGIDVKTARELLDAVPLLHGAFKAIVACHSHRVPSLSKALHHLRCLLAVARGSPRAIARPQDCLGFGVALCRVARVFHAGFLNYSQGDLSRGHVLRAVTPTQGFGFATA